MKAISLAKAFNPKEFEGRIYDFWLENGYFKPDTAARDRFVIVIPPPNVTGVLHMGHGLNIVLQDILIRYHRMIGEKTLWVPGTDHAGIATQNVVERKLRQQGIERAEIGRERFIEETWKVKHEHHGVISQQMKEIGASCDWDRERFTLDEGLSEAVREVFVGLYDRGLVYRGHYLVNWCSSCGTALSDDEVEHWEEPGKLYHYYYPLEDGSGAVEIATTRPETMLGDTAVAVHPKDSRYTKVVGKRVRLPLTDRLVPIVADEFVDMEFGTGAVKVTPAHDPNDWDIAVRHGLEKINILNDDGTLNDAVPEPYRGLPVREGRKRVVEDLKAEDLFIRDEDHPHQVGHCYRCDTLVEPYLSRQWFVRMKPLAEKALKALRDDDIRFFPKKWENTYTHWLDNIRDWCISRQLWWGHRIPVWYCDECGEMMVRRVDPDRCSSCESTSIRQDPDVLDTWFSSWLWPFSTLGWPDETEDLKSFFPTTALVTAYDIIFFWVARMIMAGMEFMGEAPFRDIYIHGLVRDKQGRKMSKSLGNGIDPLEIVHEYGADALKFTLSFLAAQGQDILIDKESFKLGSKFANKIWNAARYLLMNLEGRSLVEVSPEEFDDSDRWIRHRMNVAVEQVRSAMASFRFNDASQAVYEFFWNDFCDWYIEASKLKLYSDADEVKDKAISGLIELLKESLKMLHPFLSFITEEIYRRLPDSGDSIIVAEYPVYREEWNHPEIAERFGLVQELVRGIRTLRSEFTIPPATKIRAHIRSDRGFEAEEFFRRNLPLITDLVGGSTITLGSERVDRGGSIPVPGKGYEALVYIKEAVDIDTEIGRLEKDQEKAKAQLEKVLKKLGNEQFLEKAPEEIVAKEREISAELEEKIGKIERYLADLAK
jgi:valyl-tRNA synthetase